VIGYDARRGEPRGKKGSATGDCVDCGLCVAVCPTEIDIRQGMQLECIACTQCIDACNGVMAQLERPSDLIGYRALRSLEGRGEARLLRPRTAIYGTLLAFVSIAFVALLVQRLPMDFQVQHGAGALYTKTADGRIGNAFSLHIENRDRIQRVFRLGLEESDSFELIVGLNPITVPAVSALEARVFVLPKAGLDPGSVPIRFVLDPLDDATRPLHRSARYVSPGGKVAP